jgi:transposase-like protein
VGRKPIVGRLTWMQPLPLVPPGSLAVAEGVAFLEDEERTGTVFIWGQACFTWDGTDPGARRLAAVQLVKTGAASQRQVARAFSVNETTLWRWRGDYSQGGLSSLLPERPGPRRPSKLTEDKIAEIRALRASGASLREVAKATGVSTDSVRRAIAPVVPPPRPAPRHGEDELVPLAAPADRTAERSAARCGLLTEAKPVICEGSSLPGVGALVILPALALTGLLDAASAVYGAGRKVKGSTRSAFYGIRSLLLAICFACLLGEPRAEGMTRLDPVGLGRLLGLDRAPEVRRLRARMAELAAEHRSDELVMSLARAHLDARPEATGLFYVDGHVRAYHGNKDVGKAHLARMRIAMPGEVDTYVCDRFGDGLLVWQSPPGTSLAGELGKVTGSIRGLVGEDARPTVCFDRGGWSPKLFAKLVDAGFDILTYRKGASEPVRRSLFEEHVFTDEAGHEHHYLLADQRVRISYDGGRHRFSCRQVTRLDDKTGHQTAIITTRSDPDPGLVGHAMFSRWRQENFFRYGRQRFGLDALDSYETEPDDPNRLVKNPTRRDADKRVREAKESIEKAEAEEGRSATEGYSTEAEVLDAFAGARAELKAREDNKAAIPTKLPLGQVRPEAVRVDVERKRIHDAVRMATYNAESGLARLIAPHYARAEDEARSLLREIYASAGDLEVLGSELHVRITPLSAPRRTRALAGLCADLTETETIYPGTDLRLVYSVSEP